MTSSIVVTGASGFVGRHVVRHLSRQGIPVVALSRQRSVTASGPLTVVQIVENYEDFTPQADDVLIHLAEPPHIASVDAQGAAHAARMQQQASALIARRYRRMIYVSSATVYDDSSETPWPPDASLKAPAKNYAQSKLAVEKQFVAAGGVIARLTNLYGPGMAKTTIFADIFSQLDKTGGITIRESTPVRDYLWIDDAAAALAAMALGERTGIYNVASGVAIACGDLAAMILNLAGKPDRPVRAMLPPRHSVLRLDISKTTTDFGWIPEVDLPTGIRMLLKPDRT